MRAKGPVTSSADTARHHEPACGRPVGQQPRPRQPAEAIGIPRALRPASGRWRGGEECLLFSAIPRARGAARAAAFLSSSCLLLLFSCSLFVLLFISLRSQRHELAGPLFLCAPPKTPTPLQIRRGRAEELSRRNHPVRSLSGVEGENKNAKPEIATRGARCSEAFSPWRAVCGDGGGEAIGLCAGCLALKSVFFLVFLRRSNWPKKRFLWMDW